MSINEIKQYIKQIGLDNKPVISKLGQGESNNNFLIDYGNVKYVLRKSREDSTTKSRLYNENIILKFLEEEGLSFVPKVINYNKNKDILIISFIPGTSCSVKDLSIKQFDTLSKHLKKISNLKFIDFLNFCKKNKFKKPIIDSPEKSFKKYTLAPYKYIYKNEEDSNFLKWAKEKIETLTDNNKVNKRKGKISFNHGDLVDNLMIDKNDVYIIDWEFARFSQSNSYEGNWGYVFAHENVSKKLTEYIITKQAQLSGVKTQRIKQDIFISIQKNILNSTLWAAQRYLEMKAIDMKGWKKYRKLMITRMNCYDKKIKAIKNEK
jgi:predicted Ser/Thr protein kinase